MDKQYVALKIKQLILSGNLIYTIALYPFLGYSEKQRCLLGAAVRYRLIKRLEKKYSHIRNNDTPNPPFSGVEQDILYNPKDNTRKKCVWVYWHQGYQNAPTIVKICIDSIFKNCDREVILLNKDNFSNYITLPDYILNKFCDGMISIAHFSDLIRCALLLKYGGTWLDATCFVTKGKLLDRILDAKLFFFHQLRHDLEPIRISNWCISSDPNNNIIRFVYICLCDYWRKNNSIIDYFLFHNFVEIAINYYPEEWANVMPLHNDYPHFVQNNADQLFSLETWNLIKHFSPIQKLSYKMKKSSFTDQITYYDYLMNSRNDN
jgi:hypothetical protein